MAAAMRGRAVVAGYKARGADLLSPEMRQPIESLLSQAYGKPVELNITRLAKPHLDSGLLAAVVTQRLRDRRVTPRIALKEAVTKVALPAPGSMSARGEYDALAVRALRRKPSLRGLGMNRTTVTNVLHELQLKQVSSLRVEVAGRLGKRMTANRSAYKDARKGMTTKGPGYLVRGVRPIHSQYSLRHGKRRVGAFGVKVTVGHM